MELHLQSRGGGRHRARHVRTGRAPEKQGDGCSGNPSTCRRVGRRMMLSVGRWPKMTCLRVRREGGPLRSGSRAGRYVVESDATGRSPPTCPQRAHILPSPHPASDGPISSDPEQPLIWGDSLGPRSWEVSNPAATTRRAAAAGRFSPILALLAVVESATCGNELARKARKGCAPSRAGQARSHTGPICAITSWTHPGLAR